jgi:pantoate--beta-alanine ligase
MRVVETKRKLREALAPARREEQTIGLVPTMGDLHDGHVALIEAARSECDVVVMSLFVNPAQFGPGEDLESYPRDRDRDVVIAEAAGVDLVYAPAVEEAYPPGFATSVEVEGLTEVLCGAPGRRGPEHFRGVTTIVAKLFNAVGPDAAYFGQKDAQQVVVIRRMTRDLDLPVEIAVVPTVREADGLALSSRNAYLSADERERALALPRALERARADLAGGGAVDAALDQARQALSAAGFGPIDYFALVDAGSLEPVEEPAGEMRLIAAATIGTTRLIDNVRVSLER